jgi:feruloyl esterase
MNIHRIDFRKCSFGFVLIAQCLMLAAPKPASAGSCESLATLEFPQTAIEKAEVVTQGVFKTVDNKPIENLPPFCRVTAVLKPSPDSDIRVEMWLPQSGWNGRLEGTGSGGLAGFIYYEQLATGLRNGYAVVNTDMGMSVPGGSDASIFFNRPERWVDWGYRSTHEMTVFAKKLVEAYYGRAAQRSYFSGCSTGGQQAMSEAQHYPEDYDGMVAGAPPNNRTGVHLNILWSFMAMHRTPEAYIPASKISLLEKAVLTACAGRGNIDEGVINDPRQCRFDPASLLCKGSDNDSCLTGPQVETARMIYQGPRNPRTHGEIYPGVPRGSESLWLRDFGAPPAANEQPPFAPMFQWVFGTGWQWRSFDFDTQATALIHRLAPSVNATNPDLDQLRKLGHKLLVYHGWEDSLVVPEESVNYWKAVHAREQSRPAPASAGKIDDSYRLFMVPGMGHCGGGPGAESIDPLSAMVKWVEDGVAPERIIATKYRADPLTPGIAYQRPLCPYPQVAHYRGSGKVEDAASYACVNPDKLPAKR